MATGDHTSGPRYSFPATSRHALGLDHAVRVDFSDDGFSIYQRHINYRRDDDYSLLRRVRYSEVVGCEYVAPRIESRMTLTGLVWANMPAEVELSFPRSDTSPPLHGHDSIWHTEQLLVSGADIPETEFQGVYAWLRARVGTVSRTP